MRATLALVALFVAALVIGLHFGYGAEQKFEQRFCENPAVCSK